MFPLFLSYILGKKKKKRSRATVEEEAHLLVENSEPRGPEKPNFSAFFVLLCTTMPGVMERMELRKVATEGDDDSTTSLEDRFTEPIDSEKATIDRLVTREVKMPAGV